MRYYYLLLCLLLACSTRTVYGQSDRLPGNATSTQQQGYLVNATDTLNRQNWLYYGNGKADRMVRYPELLRTYIVNQSYAKQYTDSLYLLQMQLIGLNKNQANQRLDSLKASTAKLNGGNTLIGNQIIQSGYLRLLKEGLYMGDNSTNGTSYIGPQTLQLFNSNSTTAWQWYGPQNAFRFFNPVMGNYAELRTDYDGTNNVSVLLPLVSGRLVTDVQGAASYGSKAQQDANTNQITISKAQITADSTLLRAKADTSRSTYSVSQAIGSNGSQDLHLAASVTSADYTSQVQVLLNKAKGGKSIRILWDARISVRNLTIYSNTEIIAAFGAGAMLRDSVNAAMFQNANFTYNAGIADSNIVIKGGTWNFNGQKQLHDTPAGGWVAGFRFGGVKNLRIEETIQYKPKTFTTWVMNGENLWFNKNIVDVGTNPAINADGLHVNGPYKNVWAQQNRLRTYDDGIGINADDNLAGNYFAPNGDILNVFLKDNVLDNSLFGYRIFTGSHRIENLQVDGLTGTTKGYAIVLDDYWQNVVSNSPTKTPTTTDGPGNFGFMSIDHVNVNVTAKGVTFPVLPSIINMVGQFDKVLIRDINRRYFGYNAPMINIDQSYTSIRELIVDGLTSIDTTGTNTNPAILFSNGTAVNVAIRNAHVEKPADVDAPVITVAGGNIANLSMIGIYTKGVINQVKINGSASVNTIGVNNNRQVAATTSTSVVSTSSSSTITAIDVRGFRSNGALKSGTGTVTKLTSDTAFVSRNLAAISMDGNISIGSTKASVGSSDIKYNITTAIGPNSGTVAVLQAKGDPAGIGAMLQLNGDSTAAHQGYLYHANGSTGLSGTFRSTFGLKFLTGANGTALPFVMGVGAAGIPLSQVPNTFTLFPATAAGVGASTVIKGDGVPAVNNGYLFDIRGSLYADGLATLNGGIGSAGNISQTGGNYFRQYYSTTANEYFTIAPNTSTGTFDIGTYVGTSGSNRAMNITSASSIMFDARNYNSMIWKFGGTNFFLMNTSTFYPATTNQIDFGGTGNRLKSGWFTTLNAGHIVGTSAAPTIAAGTGAGTSPTISVSGSDVSGTITITTGSSPVAGAAIATITFNSAYLAAPHPAGNPAAKNAISASLAGNASPYYTTTVSTLVLNANSTGLAANTTYVWDYTLTQ